MTLEALHRMRPPRDPVPENYRDPQALPYRCVVHLLPSQIRKEILTGLPENLRGKFHFYGGVTPEEYRLLTGDAACSQMKWRLGAETVSKDNFTIYIAPEDVLTQESGAKAVQSRLLRYWLEQASQEVPASDAEYQEIAKTLDEMSYAALEFLLGIAELYSVDAADLSDQDMEEALNDQHPELSWDDFAYPHPEV